MTDLYLYEDCPVLRNKLDIKDSDTLDLVEAEQSNTNMMLLYERGFSDFTPEGFRKIHATLFGDIYEWAGKDRLINIKKREKVLAGISVWYSNENVIKRDLSRAFMEMNKVHWCELSRTDFVDELVRIFPQIWKVHPFREGNTRTLVMFLTFFVEHYGFYFDQALVAASAGYVRDAFVMACIGEYAEPEHLQKILLDAVSSEPIEYAEAEEGNGSTKASQYQTEPYLPQYHESRSDDYNPKEYRK